MGMRVRVLVVAYLEVLDRKDAHLVYDRDYLSAEDLDDADVFLGVGVGGEDAFAKDLVVQLHRGVHSGVRSGLRGDLLSGQAKKRRKCWTEELDGLVFGGQRRKEAESRKDGVLKDLGQTRVAERLIGVFFEEALEHQ